MIRSGIGYDVHRLEKGRKLILGGVEITHSHGLEGHSDADVLSHAIADALLGAVAAGDIGQHFPNTDESIRGLSSLEILRRVAALLAEKKAKAKSIDVTVIAEEPKIGPHIPAMRSGRTQDRHLHVRANCLQPRAHRKFSRLHLRGFTPKASRTARVQGPSRHEHHRRG